MDEIKKAVLSLNVVGPNGDEKQDFQVGTNDSKTVVMQLGTVVIGDNGKGDLLLDGSDLIIKRIKLGDAMITFNIDSSTEEAIINISGGKIYLDGSVNVVGEITQLIDSSNN